MKGVRFAIAVLLVASTWALGQERPLIIKASTVLDGKGGTLRNTSIVVQGSRIARIDPNAQGVNYDLSGLTVMPGWIDTHVHMGNHFDRNGRAHSPASAKDETPEQSMLYAVENAYLTLMGGFTTVQSLGSPVDRDLRDWIAGGTIPGPRILTSLRPVNETTGSPSQIRQFVRQVAAEGADVIKIFASKSIRDGGAQSLSDEQVQAACGEARAAGLRSVVHAQDSGSARAAILAGCTAVEHGNRLSDEVIRLMAERGTYLDPHFGLLFANYLQNKDKFFGIGNYTEEGFTAMEKAIPVGIETFRRTLANKRLKIVFGTDAVAGSNGRNYEEFIYRVKDGGQQPMDALVSATSLAAQSLNMADQIGTIAPGMEADIIAVAGNPLDDITAVRRVVFVMKGGKVYKNLHASVSPRSK